MQARETGINMLRIYNPIKNSKKHDPERLFIKKWIPKLSDIPVEYINELHLMPPLEQHFFNFNIGEDYLKLIVAIEQTSK